MDRFDSPQGYRDAPREPGSTPSAKQSVSTAVQVTLVLLGIGFFVSGIALAFGGITASDMLGGWGEDDSDVPAPAGGDGGELDDSETRAESDVPEDDDQSPGDDGSADDRTADDDDAEDADHNDGDDIGPSGDVSFDAGVYTNNVGDVVEIGLNSRDIDLDQVDIVVRLEDPESAFYAEFEVTELDGDDASIRLNSYHMGQPGETDRAYVPVLGEIDDIDQFEFDDDHLPAGDYELTVTVDGGPYDDEELDHAVVSFSDRSTENASTLAAPEGSELNDVGDIEEHATAQDEIEVGDYAIVRVEASGIYGYANLRNGEGDVNFYVTEQGIGLFGSAHEFDVEEDGVEVIWDPENNQFFVVIDTAEIDEMEAGDEYTATFSIGEDNPYVDEEEYVSTDFEIVERSE